MKWRSSKLQLIFGGSNHNLKINKSSRQAMSQPFHLTQCVCCTTVNIVENFLYPSGFFIYFLIIFNSCKAKNHILKNCLTVSSSASVFRQTTSIVVSRIKFHFNSCTIPPALITGTKVKKALTRWFSSKYCWWVISTTSIATELY